MYQGSHICINISGEMGSGGGGATSADAQVQKRLGGSCTSARVPAGSCPSFPWLIKKQFCALGAGQKECSQTTRQAPLRARRLQTVMRTQPLQKRRGVQHSPVGLSEPLHQQLLFHFPSFQARFLSVIHRDYSYSNQNREEKAPQNTRGTK